MRFLVDECTGPAVARWLRDEQKHDVFSVYDEMPGAQDEELIQKAFRERWILITNDKDFGEKVFKERHPHCGVIFLRLENETAPNKIKVLKRLLDGGLDRLTNHFVVATETQVRYSGSIRATTSRDSDDI